MVKSAFRPPRVVSIYPGSDVVPDARKRLDSVFAKFEETKDQNYNLALKWVKVSHYGVTTSIDITSELGDRWTRDSPEDIQLRIDNAKWLLEMIEKNIPKHFEEIKKLIQSGKLAQEKYASEVNNVLFSIPHREPLWNETGHLLSWIFRSYPNSFLALQQAIPKPGSTSKEKPHEGKEDHFQTNSEQREQPARKRKKRKNYFIEDSGDKPKRLKPSSDSEKKPRLGPK